MTDEDEGEEEEEGEEGEEEWDDDGHPPSRDELCNRLSRPQPSSDARRFWRTRRRVRRRLRRDPS